ncbi:hypothetical protein MJN54_29920, partial [Salmonella enterica subsp. enterica serovar Kentucky]|nr:hypothetical protein [Salmonella enterica subsp. enterica serovar Kentucky]
SAAFWSQNNGLQLQNLTIENTLGDSVDAGNHPAVALRTDGDKDGTLRENLTLGAPHANDEQIFDALEVSGGAVFVRRLAKGLDHP